MLLLQENARSQFALEDTRSGRDTHQADILVAQLAAGLNHRKNDQARRNRHRCRYEPHHRPTEFASFFAGDAKREAAFAKRGSILIGDVHPKAFEQAGAYTPVPGGVGPLTIAC